MANNARVRSPILSYTIARQQIGRFGIWLEGFDNEEIRLDDILNDDIVLTDAVIHLLIRFIGILIAELDECKIMDSSDYLGIRFTD